MGKIKNTGIARKVDDLGRVVIPVEIRNNLGIEEGDSIEFYIEGRNIILKKQSNKQCTNCGQDVDNLDKFCRMCGKEL